MDIVVTEELRGRGPQGRALVEGEEDVAIVKDLITSERHRDDVIREAARVTAQRAVQAAVRANSTRATGWDSFDMGTLTTALADPNVAPGPHTTKIIRQYANRKQSVSNQPTSAEFLSRDYHSFRASRFLFSCSTDPDGCAMNRGSAWHYAIPEVGTEGAGSSSDGAVLGQIGRVVLPGCDDASGSRSADGGPSPETALY